MLKNLLLATILVPFMSAAYAGEEFHATLSGDAEVPAVITDTTGVFRFDFDSFDETGSYRLRILEGERVTQVHIHCGASGESGPAILYLAGLHELGWDVDGKWIDNATLSDQNIVDGNTECGETLVDVVESMRNGNAYVNVHTLSHPGGEVRGQIRAIANPASR
ncbi:MAG: CHRD domain-containing protein [Moraxellaceae bacterium]|nr:MAG: CHRD domain-containing protein [Moraxellaceae bacterium]